MSLLSVPSPRASGERRGQLLILPPPEVAEAGVCLLALEPDGGDPPAVWPPPPLSVPLRAIPRVLEPGAVALCPIRRGRCLRHRVHCVARQHSYRPILRVAVARVVQLDLQRLPIITFERRGDRWILLLQITRIEFDP